MTILTHCHKKALFTGEPGLCNFDGSSLSGWVADGDMDSGQNGADEFGAMVWMTQRKS